MTSMLERTSMILDGLVRVLSTCRACGELMQVTEPGQTVHPTCEAEPTRLEKWQASWLEIATSAPYDKLRPELRNQLERLEFKMEAAADEGAETALHNAAMQYAEWGWPVFPLARNAKTPAIPKRQGGNGFKDATSDTNRICRWWSKHPDHNVGLATGHLFDVIDIDPRSGGAVSLTKLLADGRIPVVHGIVATANGGLHLYVKPSGRGNFAGVMPGVDYRAIGGYCCAPPSTLGTRVRTWAWTVEPSPEIKA